MWPFSNTRRDLEPCAYEEQRWNLGMAEDEGGLIVVRCNQTAREWAGHARFPVRLGFAIPLTRPNEGQPPAAEENVELTAIEDLIVAKVFAATSAVHVLSLTTGVMKEHVFYIPRGVNIPKLHLDIQAGVPSHHVQCIAVDDPEWQVYREYSVESGPQLRGV